MKLTRVSSLLAGCMMMASAAAFAADDAKPKILFLTHSAGFKHSSLATAERVFLELGQKSGAYEGTVLEGYKQNQKEIDLSAVTPEYLDQFAAVMFFTTGELPFTDAQKQALVDFIRNGKAWIGTHSATDTYYKWEDYRANMSGAYFRGHGPNDKNLTLKIEDTNHPATKMLGTQWIIADEFYQFKPESFSREEMHVLISVDKLKSDLAPQRMKAEEDYPLAWCRNVGKGRSFYTALGHREDIWTNPKFQEHLLGGIKWALGLEPGDATPSAKIEKK